MSQHPSEQHNDDLEDGLQEGHGGGGRFIGISGGKFVERVPEGTEGSVSRVLQKGPNAGKTIWEKSYGVLTGKIEGMFNRVRTVNYGDGDKEAHSSIVILSVDGQRLNVEINCNTRQWFWFVASLPNIDLTRKVRLSPFDYVQRGTGKKIIGLGVTQAPTAAQKADPQTVFEKDGTVKVPWFWTKENPGKLPPVEEFVHPKTGEKEVYFDKRDEYLRGVVEHYGNKLKSQNEQALNEAEAVAATQAKPATAPSVANTTADINSEVPNPFPEGDDDFDSLPF